MTQRQKNIIIPIALIGIVTVVYFYVKKINTKPASKFTNKQPTIKKEVKPTIVKEQQTFPLKVGSNNVYVKQLQDALGVSIDGIFGKDTLAALNDQTGLSKIDTFDMLNAVYDYIFLFDNDFTKNPYSVFDNMDWNRVEDWYDAANNGEKYYQFNDSYYKTVEDGFAYPSPPITVNIAPYTPSNTDGNPQ